LRVLSSKPSGAESTRLHSSVTCLRSFVAHAFGHPRSFILATALDIHTAHCGHHKHYQNQKPHLLKVHQAYRKPAGSRAYWKLALEVAPSEGVPCLLKARCLKSGLLKARTGSHAYRKHEPGPTESPPDPVPIESATQAHRAHSKTAARAKQRIEECPHCAHATVLDNRESLV